MAKRDWNLVGHCVIVYAHGNFLFKVLLIAANGLTHVQRGREGLPTKVHLGIQREGGSKVSIFFAYTISE